MIATSAEPYFEHTHPLKYMIINFLLTKKIQSYNVTFWTPITPVYKDKGVAITVKCKIEISGEIFFCDTLGELSL